MILIISSLIALCIGENLYRGDPELVRCGTVSTKGSRMLAAQMASWEKTTSSNKAANALRVEELIMIPTYFHVVSMDKYVVVRRI